MDALDQLKFGWKDIFIQNFLEDILIFKKPFHVAILLIYAVFVREKNGSSFRFAQLSEPTTKHQAPIPRKSLRCVLPMPMRQMVEMELPFFYWDPWQSTAAGGGCAIPGLGREGEKLGTKWLPVGEVCRREIMEIDELRWFVMETWSCLWHECHYSHGADNDNADWNGDAVMLHAKHLLYGMLYMYQYVSYADTTNNNRSIITISQWREFCIACSEFGVANLWSLSATVCGFLHLNASGFSVRPNAFKYIQSDGARVKLYIRALEDLRVGDKVSISYIPDAQKGIRSAGGGAFLCSENSIAIWIYTFFWHSFLTVEGQDLAPLLPMNCIDCFIHLNCKILLFHPVRGWHISSWLVKHSMANSR